jgi:mannose-6-phosphate isomerase-like protein (cupin superfamily)
MSAEFRPCTTADTGWRPDEETALDFRAEGSELAVELKRWTREDIAQLDAAPGLVEEMGAVLGGRFELVCEEERYELEAGGGILIPAGVPRRWRLLSETGVLYRVFPR